MRGIQKDFGEERLAVLMVDNEHYLGTSFAKAEKKAKKFFAESKLDMPWKRVLLHGGGDTVHKALNFSGYGLILIDPQGKVLETNIHHRLLRKLLLKKMPKEKASKPTVADRPSPGGTVPVLAVATSQKGLLAGESTEIILTLTIPKGWHVYGSEETSGIPITVAVQNSKHLEIGQAQIPPGLSVSRYGAVSHELSGTVRVILPVRIPKEGKPGSFMVKGKLNYMMCDENSCLPPSQLAWQTKIVVK